MTTPTTLPMPSPVNAPEVSESRSGLVPVARSIGRVHELDDSAFGLGGITYRPETIDGARARSNSTDNEGTDVNRSPDEDDKGGLVTAYPIVLSVEEECSAFGWKAQDYEGRATRRLTALGAKVLEWEFWTGEVAQMDGLDPAVYQWLAQPRVAAAGAIPAHGAVDLTPAGGALDVRHALAELEQAIGESGPGSGFVHMTRRMGVLMPDKWTEGPIITWPDSYVAVGAGYSGVGPDGAPPPAGEEWVYATNICDVWFGTPHIFPDTLAEALDRSKNTIAYRAERLGAVTWDGNSHFAIRVTI